MSKGMSLDHHLFCGTRKGAPTNWAGTPNDCYLPIFACFAKPLLGAKGPKIRKFRRVRRAGRSPRASAAAKHGGRLDFDTRPHGRRDRDAVDEGAFGTRWLGLLHRVRERLDVLDELFRRKRRLADAGMDDPGLFDAELDRADRKSTRLNSSHLGISYAVFCLKKKKI